MTVPTPSSSATPWNAAGLSSFPCSPGATRSPSIPRLMRRCREVCASPRPARPGRPALALHNPLDEDVLLYDGEELVGAKQNRILNVSVLAAAGTKLSIPVSCEDGAAGLCELRLGSARSRPGASTQERALAAPPCSRAGTGRGMGQRARESRPYGCPLPDTRERRRLHALSADPRARGRLPAQPGQCGAVFALDDALCLDAVSRPDAFAHLWPKLRAGYLLDALERLDASLRRQDRISDFVDEVAHATATRGPSVGLGEDVRLRGRVA